MATTDVTENNGTSCSGTSADADCLYNPNGILATTEHGLTLLVMVAVIVSSFVNNTCIIGVIIRAPHLRRQLSYVFVLNLCIVDVCASILTLPFMVLSQSKGLWPFKDEFCLAQGFLVTFFIILSIMSISTISIDRLYSIKAPMHYAANVTLGRVLFTIFTIWVFASVIAVVPIFDIEGYTFQTSKMYCFVKWSAGWSHSSYIFAFSTIAFIMPSIVIIIMYIGIYQVARKTANQIHPMPMPSGNAQLPSVGNVPQKSRSSVSSVSSPQTPSSPQGKEESVMKPNIAINGAVQPGLVQSSEACANHNGNCGPDTVIAKSNKAVKTLMLITLTFVVLWAPFFIFNMYCANNRGVGCSPSADWWTSVLGFSSFAVNPLVYGIMNRSVREELLERLRHARYCCRKNPDADEGPANEDFFEFLERTSVQPQSVDMTVGRKLKVQKSKMTVFCGAAKAATNDLHRVTINSISSIC